MKNKIIISFVDVNFNRYFAKNVLGKIFDFSINGLDMKLHFPDIPSQWQDDDIKDKLHCPLSSPTISRKYKVGNKEIFYGMPRSYPEVSSEIEKVVVSVELEEPVQEKKINLICDGINKTIQSLYKLCYIVNEDICPNAFAEQRSCEINLYDDLSGKIIPNIEEEVLVYIHDDNKSITKKQLEKMLNIISKQILIPIEYDFLVSGIESYERYDNRKCILDLSTACEIAITSKIEEIQKKLNVKNLLEDYKTLYAKYKLLGLLNFDISFADIKVVTEIRNKAIHKGNGVTDTQAYEAIKVTRSILKKISKFY